MTLLPLRSVAAADILSLAAAPTFALMAALTPVLDTAPGMLCGASPDALPLNGMVLMYGLMGAFHLGPWLRLLPGRRPRAA